MQQSEITLSQLQRKIHEALVDRFVMPMWVSAEIADIKVNGSGHCYMELVEKGESDGVAKAQARAVVWRSSYGVIAQKFELHTGQQLERGLKILARVTVNYHEMYGLSLQVLDIDPTYTLGEVERQRQLAIARLKSNGAWDKNRELQMPTVVQRIAVVSSSKAAGYQDFMREIGQCEYHFDITLFEATMQGASAEESIIEALIAIANRRDDFDCVAVIRGGGSTNDLNCFNSYRLAHHFARFPRPVVSGIGHDRDVSVVDMVAQVALKTPTAVAGWFVERMMVLDSWLLDAAQQLHTMSVEMSRSYERRLEGCESELVARVEELMTRSKRNLVDRLLQIPDLAANVVAQRRAELDGWANFVASYSPERLLALGFAVVRSGELLRGVDGVAKGDNLNIELADGDLVAEVVEVRKRQ